MTDPRDVERALSYLDSTDRDTWIRMGLACKAGGKDGIIAGTPGRCANTGRLTTPSWRQPMTTTSTDSLQPPPALVHDRYCTDCGAPVARRKGKAAPQRCEACRRARHTELARERRGWVPCPPCQDCGAPVQPTSRVRPKFCEACRARRKRDVSRRATGYIEEHRCVECAVPIPRKRADARAPERCSICAAERRNDRRRAAAGYSYTPTCIDCGVAVERRPGYRSPERCDSCQSKREADAMRRRYQEDPEFRARRRAYSRRRNRAAGKYRRHLVALLVRQRALCGICSRLLPESAPEIHIDHIVRVSEGGSSDISNLRAVCVECNLTRTDDG